MKKNMELNDSLPITPGITMKITPSLSNYLLLSICLFSFFLAWSFCFSLFPLWLHQHIGLSGEQTGIIYSINSVIALIALPCYGFIQDRLGVRRHLLIVVAFLLVLSGPFFNFVYAPLLIQSFYLGVLVGGVVIAYTFTASVAILEAYIERVARITGFEFGRVRVWGALGWACATFFSGYLFNLNPYFNFYLASCCALLFLLALMLVKPAKTTSTEVAQAKTLKLNDALTLLSLPKFWAFTLFVFGVCSINIVYDQQFPIYFASFFDNQALANQTYGQLNSLQVFLEAGCMFLAPIVVNRIGAKNGLLMAGVVMALRILGSSVADTTLEISAMKLLHAVEVPLLLVAMFKYINATFDPRLSATIFLVGFQFMSQVAAIVPAVAAGIMYDKIGFANSYLILGSLVIGFLLLSRMILSNTPMTSTFEQEPS